MESNGVCLSLCFTAHLITDCWDGEHLQQLHSGSGHGTCDTRSGGRTQSPHQKGGFYRVVGQPQIFSTKQGVRLIRKLSKPKGRLQ